MPSFKQTPQKNIKLNKNKLVTLDEKHKEIIHNFTKAEKDQLPKLRSEKKQILKRLNNSKASTSTPSSDGDENETEEMDLQEDEGDFEDSDNEPPELDIHERLNLEDRLAEIKSEIRAIKNNKKQYLLENSKYIFDYFENKKNISKDIQPAKTAKLSIVDTFFKIKSSTEQPEPENINKNIISKYFHNIDITVVDMSQYVYPTDVCRKCHAGELIVYEDEGVLICNKCYANIPYLVENEKPTYKEPPKEVCFYAYKRINHFKEIIAQFQGKETTQIHADIINTIKQQIKKERIRYFTNDIIKEILKKLGLSKYYEHIPFIMDKLGVKPPVMSPELEESLFNLFIELQRPYSKVCPDDRVNFLNYYYTLYKLCELLGETQYLDDIPMLKDREKIIEQDIIWRNMCAELGWTFIPTI
jgi:hypothetical protein